MLLTARSKNPHLAVELGVGDRQVSGKGACGKVGQAVSEMLTHISHEMEKASINPTGKKGKKRRNLKGWMVGEYRVFPATLRCQPCQRTPRF